MFLSQNFLKIVANSLNFVRTSKTMPKKTTKKPSGVEKIDQGPISIDKQGNITIKILAKPGSKQNGITDISTEGIGVQISAPPVEGEANTELIKYLSKVLGIRKGDLSLDKGSKSRTKTITVIKSDAVTVESIHQSLQKECES